MQKTKQIDFLIDFDSTFITTEGLDELAAFSLKNHPEKEERVKKIKEITTLGMEGKIPFETSLLERVSLLQTNKKTIDEISKLLAKKISPSIQRNKAFFKTQKKHIYIISGGFKEIILPVVKKFGIPPAHVFANTFRFDKNGNVIGIDETNVMSKNGGKVTVVKQLQLKNDLYIIGDGYTDYEIKKQGFAKKFIAFTENVTRDIVVKKADQVVSSFDEILYLNNLQGSLSYPKNRIKVLLLENIHPDAVELFRKEGYSVETIGKSLSEKELKNKLKDVTILGIRSKTKITKAILDAAPHLLTIGVFAIGVNQIDLSAATKRGICVFNAPYSNTRSVAELVIGEMIMLSRKTFEKSTQVHQGLWDKSAIGSHELRGRKLGIIGYGHIGSQVSVLAEALGMDVYFYNTSDRLAFGNATKCDSMEEVLSIADIVTLHVSGKPENVNVIDEKAFRKMKDGVLFLNASRGFVVDIDALVHSIKSGKVAGAAIDVYPKEPGKNGDPFETSLQGLPNVILTPHVGAGTEEAQRNIAHYVPQKIIEYINTGNTYLSVSLPNIRLPEQRNVHRLLHMHKNVSGILAQINNTFAEKKSNILGQYLKTNDTIGYVITDIDTHYDKTVIDTLKKIPGTIRVRVLY